jgi:hypothetical protein
MPGCVAVALGEKADKRERPADGCRSLYAFVLLARSRTRFHTLPNPSLPPLLPHGPERWVMLALGLMWRRWLAGEDGGGKEAEGNQG